MQRNRKMLLIQHIVLKRKRKKKKKKDNPKMSQMLDLADFKAEL